MNSFKLVLAAATVSLLAISQAHAGNCGDKDVKDKSAASETSVDTQKSSLALWLLEKQNRRDF